jgi:hypothetical protein
MDGNPRVFFSNNQEWWPYAEMYFLKTKEAPQGGKNRLIESYIARLQALTGSKRHYPVTNLDRIKEVLRGGKSRSYHSDIPAGSKRPSSGDMHQIMHRMTILRPFAVRPPVARNTIYETFMTTTIPWIAEDTFNTHDDDNLLEHFVEYLTKLKRLEIVQEWIIRCITKAFLSGVVHHLISEIHVYLTV